MDSPQARVRSVLDDLAGRDVERGLQVAAYLDGELVIDARAGLADASTGRPVAGETLFCVFSCTKGITATVIHLLAERGQLVYEAPVATCWPEFGAHGKGSITVRQVLAHTAGVPQVPDSLSVEDMCDWDRTCRAVADLSPLWEPGYHAVTYGWILGEVAREEICRPLGSGSLFVGIPAEVEPRVATLETGPPLEGVPVLPGDHLSWRAFPARIQPLGDWANRPDVRRAVPPAANGIMNARSLARHYAALIGEVDGSRLLPAARVRAATALQTEADDLVGGPGFRRALGYELGGGEHSAFRSRASAFGHGGAGGSVGFADPEFGFAFALAKTRMVSAPPGEDAASIVAREARSALGIPQ